MNETIRKNTEELEKVRVRARAVMAEYPNGLPPEQDQAVTALLEKATELKTIIERESDLENKRQDLKNLDRFLDDPVHKIPHGVNGDDNDRKSLVKAGWEVKNGVVYAPTSLEGKTFVRHDGRLEVVGKVAMYSEDALFADIPSDDDKTAEYYRKTRAIFDPRYAKAYSKFMRTAVKFRSEAMALNQMTLDEQKALSEGSDTSGGFIVPPDTQAEMLVRLAQQAIMRQYARVQPTSRDVLRWPAVAGGTLAGSGTIVSSGFVGSWVGETPAFSDTDPGFQMFDIPIRKLRVATKLSNDFVADAAVNILSFLATNGSENMALVEDYGFFQGNGGSLQPLGILNCGINTGDVEGSTVNTITNTSSSTGSAPKIGTNVAYKLPSQYVSRAKWVMRRAIEGKVRALVDGQNRPLWPDYMGSGFAAAPNSLLGSQVLTTDFMPDDGTDGNQVLLYGDLSNYIIAQRSQITSVVLRERFADTDQVGIILFERVGGAVWNTDAFYIGKV